MDNRPNRDKFHLVERNYRHANDPGMLGSPRRYGKEVSPPPPRPAEEGQPWSSRLRRDGRNAASQEACGEGFHRYRRKEEDRERPGLAVGWNSNTDRKAEENGLLSLILG